MNKKFIYTIFTISSLLMLWVVLGSFDKIKSDVYTLISLDSNDAYILESIQKRESKTIMFLSSNIDLLQSFQNNPLFKEFHLKQNITDDFLEKLKLSSLATMNSRIYNMLINNPNEFFLENANGLYSPFIFRPIKSDFLNLSAYSTLLKPSNFHLDLKTQTLKANDENRDYYFAYAILNDHFKSKDLINFYKDSKTKALESSDELLMMSSELFGAFAKKEGNNESLFMGTLSLIFIYMLLFLAFGSYKILKLLIIIIFSSLCGLSGAFLIFDYINLFSIVISISLIGLILDFAMHFLGYVQNKYIKPSDIKGFLHLFLIGLFITILGYFLFIFAPMDFLKEIAVISIFSLIGAFLSTYFLLPMILENHCFKSHRYFERFINHFIAFNDFILRQKKIFFGFIACIFVLSMIFLINILPKIDFKDDIRNYSSLDSELLDDAKKFVQRSKNSPQNRFITIRFSANEDKIQKEKSLLKELNITKYNGASNILLSDNEQNNLKKKLIEYTKDSNLMQNYPNLGIDLDLAKQSLINFANLEILSFDKFDEIFPQNPLKQFIFDDNTNLVFIDSSAILPNNFNEILEKYDASYFNLVESISNHFTTAKKYAIVLKIIAYIIAFLIFLYFFRFIKACIMLGIILSATYFSVILLLAFGVNFNIFTIFGFILASTIGVDYVLFATNENLNINERYFGIILASLTSIISFGMLGFSNTYAVFGFGISTALCMFLSAYFALLYASYKTI